MCSFNDDAHLMLIIDRIVSQVGRRVDEASPMVDARLPDGSRINAIIPPLALDGPVAVDPPFRQEALRHRRAGRSRHRDARRWPSSSMPSCGRGSISWSAAAPAPARPRCSTACPRFIPDDERIVTIEDSAELPLQQPHVVRLETRPPNVEGKGEVTQRELVKNSLRMRPDRIIVGEVRGARSLRHAAGDVHRP